MNNNTITNQQSSAKTTKRQWQILSELQRKNWMGTSEIRERVSRAGFTVSLRTIQRDLVQLTEHFPIESNNTKPQGWRWRDDSPQQNLPKMSMSEAIAFHLVESNLKQILPHSYLEEMRPWFAMAQAQLNTTTVTQQIQKNIRIIPATQQLTPPVIKSGIKDIVYEGLTQKKHIQISYQKNERVKNTDNLTMYVLNPLGLIQRGNVLYLIAIKTSNPNLSEDTTPENPQNDTNKYDDVRMFVLHRFNSAKILDTSIDDNISFDIDEYLEYGNLGFRHQDLECIQTKIKLIFDAKIGKSLIEQTISNDQLVTIHSHNSTLEITATTTLTSQLVWWLRGFGKGLKSIEPVELAQAVWETDATLL